MPGRPDEARELVDDVALGDDGAEVLEELTAESFALHPSLRVAIDFADLARTLHEQPTTELTLQRIVEHAAETVDGCEEAGVTVTRGGKPATVAATSELVIDVDTLQYETGQGPCLEALRDHAVYRTGDVGADPRWPEFGPAASRAGVRSMLSFRLFSHDETLGALNLYSSGVDVFTDGAFAVGVVLAVHAGTAFAHAREAERTQNLKAALQTNRTIGMAVGVVMVTASLDHEAAFRLLTQESSRRNLKLARLAEQVVLDRGLHVDS